MDTHHRLAISNSNPMYQSSALRISFPVRRRLISSARAHRLARFLS